MKFPVVYDKSERDFSKLGLAVLENASEVKIHQVINGEYILSLVLPRNDEKWEYIKEENIIVVEAQAFRIRSFDEQRNNWDLIPNMLKDSPVQSSQSPPLV